MKDRGLAPLRGRDVGSGKRLAMKESCAVATACGFGEIGRAMGQDLTTRNRATLLKLPALSAGKT